MNDAVFTCAFCGEPNYTTVDLGGGSHQRHVEACQVCCRPNEIDATWDSDLGGYVLSADAEM